MAEQLPDINIFETINNFAALRGYYKTYSSAALNWFRKEVSQLGKINKLKLLGDNIQYQQSRPQVGSFCLFFYSAIGYRQKTLPYFDTFPLTIMLSADDKHVGGLNMHYLPPMDRLKLLQKIIEIEGSEFGETTKLSMTYDLIKAATDLYKPTYHKYLFKEIRSQVVVIPAESIVPAIFLPIANFKGSTQTQVWKDSLDKI